MKKKLLALLLCLLTLSMLAACGSNDSDDGEESTRKNKTTEASSQKSTDKDDDDDDDDDDVDVDDDDEEATTRKHSTSAAMFEDIDEYLADETVANQLESLIEMYEGQGLDVAIFGDYDTITYTYTYTEDMLASGITLDEIAEQLDSYFETAKSSMQTSVNQIQSLVEVSPIKNVIEYYNVDGTLLYTITFTAE